MADSYNICERILFAICFCFAVDLGGDILFNIYILCAFSLLLSYFESCSPTAVWYLGKLHITIYFYFVDLLAGYTGILKQITSCNVTVLKIFIFLEYRLQ